MDAHNDGVAVSDLDAATTDDNSFEAALDAAFRQLDIADGILESSPKEETKETEASEEPAEDSKEESTDDVSDDVSDETKPEEDPLDALDEDTDWTPKAAKRFKTLKAELKSSRSELEQLRQQAKEQQAKLQEMEGLAESKDVEELRQKISEYEQSQKFSNLEKTFAYQEAVAKPLEALVSEADAIAEKYEIEPESLIDLLSLTDPEQQDERLAELLPNASDRDKAKLYKIIESINPILERRQQMFDEVDAALNEAALLEETRTKYQAAEKLRMRQEVTKDVVSRITQKLPFLSGFEGVDLKQVESKAASIDPTVVHPVDFAYNAVSAQLLPAVVREYASLRKELDVLTDKLAEYETAEPAISGGSTGSRSGKSVGDGGFLDAISRAFG